MAIIRHGLSAAVICFPSWWKESYELHLAIKHTHSWWKKSNELPVEIIRIHSWWKESYQSPVAIVYIHGWWKENYQSPVAFLCIHSWWKESYKSPVAIICIHSWWKERHGLSAAVICIRRWGNCLKNHVANFCSLNELEYSEYMRQTANLPHNRQLNYRPFFNIQLCTTQHVGMCQNELMQVEVNCDRSTINLLSPMLAIVYWCVWWHSISILSWLWHFCTTACADIWGLSLQLMRFNALWIFILSRQGKAL